jgi:hypothetical protein
MHVPPDDGPTTNLRSLLLFTLFYSTNLSTTYISKSELKTHPLRVPNGSANEATDFFKLRGGKIGTAAREKEVEHMIRVEEKNEDCLLLTESVEREPQPIVVVLSWHRAYGEALLYAR